MINPSKFIVLGRKLQCEKMISHEPTLVFAGIPMEIVKTVRNLGLLLNSELRYVEHLNVKIKYCFY